VRRSVKAGEVPHPPDRRAFTLVEVVVALVLLGVGALGMGALLRLSSMEARAADHRERALWVLAHVADSLEVSGWGGTGRSELPDGGQVRWSGTASGAEVQGVLPGGDSVWIRLPVLPTPRQERLRVKE
jgi:prepilin-type N-terminal cleavage/methylation domain-containing protein